MSRFGVIVEIARIMWRSRHDGFHQERVAVLRDSSSLGWKLGMIKVWAELAPTVPKEFSIFGGDLRSQMVIMARGGFESVEDIESRFEDYAARYSTADLLNMAKREREKAKRSGAL